jgi:hypothetical protein
MLIGRLDDAALRLSRFKSRIPRFTRPVNSAGNDIAALAQLEPHVGEGCARSPQLGQLVVDAQRRQLSR